MQKIIGPFIPSHGVVEAGVLLVMILAVQCKATLKLRVLRIHSLHRAHTKGAASTKGSWVSICKAESGLVILRVSRTNAKPSIRSDKQVGAMVGVPLGRLLLTYVSLLTCSLALQPI